MINKNGVYMELSYEGHGVTMFTMFTLLDGLLACRTPIGVAFVVLRGEHHVLDTRLCKQLGPQVWLEQRGRKLFRKCRIPFPRGNTEACARVQI